MSLERKVGRAVLDLGDLIKANVVAEVSKAQGSGLVKLSDRDMQELVKAISAVVDSTSRNGVDGVLRLVKHIKD